MYVQKTYYRETPHDAITGIARNKEAREQLAHNPLYKGKTRTKPLPVQYSKSITDDVQHHYQDTVHALTSKDIVIVANESQLRFLDELQLSLCILQKPNRLSYSVSVAQHGDMEYSYSAHRRVSLFKLLYQYKLTRYTKPQPAQMYRDSRVLTDISGAMPYYHNLADTKNQKKKIEHWHNLDKESGVLHTCETLQRAYDIIERYADAKEETAMMQEHEAPKPQSSYYSEALQGYTTTCKYRSAFVGYEQGQLRPFETEEQLKKYLQGRPLDHSKSFHVVPKDMIVY